MLFLYISNINILLLQLKDLRVGQWEEYWVNTRELDRELYTGLFILYTNI